MRADKSGPDSHTELVLDLDGTLCRSDTLHNTMIGVARQSTLKLPYVLLAMMQGEAAFKKVVTNHCVTLGAYLHYNQDVLDPAQTALAEGRQIVLVSALDQWQVDAVPQDLKIFDEAIGTGRADGAENVNLEDYAREQRMISVGRTAA